MTFDYLMDQMKKHNIHIDSVDKLCENNKLKDNDGFYNETGFLLSDQNDYIIKVIKYGELPYFLDLDAFYSGKSMPINEALFKIFLIK